MRTLGATLGEVAEGRTTMPLPCDPVEPAAGYLHAGALVAVLDSACGYAAMSVTAPGSEVLTAELKVDLLATAARRRGGRRGRVVRAGRYLIICQGDTHDADDPSKHLATMLMTMAVLSRAVELTQAFPRASGPERLVLLGVAAPRACGRRCR